MCVRLRRQEDATNAERPLQETVWKQPGVSAGAEFPELRAAVPWRLAANPGNQKLRPIDNSRCGPTCGSPVFDK